MVSDFLHIISVSILFFCISFRDWRQISKKKGCDMLHMWPRVELRILHAFMLPTKAFWNIPNSLELLLPIVPMLSTRLNRLWHICLFRQIYSPFRSASIGKHAGWQSIHIFSSATHQRNVVFVFVVTLSNWITGLAVRSTHKSFGGPSQETSPAEGQPFRGEREEHLNHSLQYVRRTHHYSVLSGASAIE